MQRQQRMNVGTPLGDVATLVVPGDEISESHDVSPFKRSSAHQRRRGSEFLQLVDDEMSPASQYLRQAFDADGQAM